LKSGVERAFFVELTAQAQRAAKLLDGRGVRLLAGTDALNPMIIPGLSLHDEFALLREADLSPYRVLRTATVNPAALVRGLGNAGTIAAGKDADLVLVSGNPLTDLAVLRAPEGVVLKGRWFDRTALNARLEAVARTYGR